MPRSPYGRSFLDRILGLPTYEEYLRQAKERVGTQPTEPLGTASVEFSPYGEAPPYAQLQREALSQAFGGPAGDVSVEFSPYGSPDPKDAVFQDEARQAQLDARKQGRGGLREGFLAQLPFLVQALTADTTQQMHSALSQAAEVAERQRTLTARRKDEEEERAFREKLIEDEQAHRVEERIAGETFTSKMASEAATREEDREAYRMLAEDARFSAQLNAEETRQRENMTFQRTGQILEGQRAEAMARLSASLSEQTQRQIARDEAIAKVSSGLSYHLALGMPSDKVQALMDLAKKDPYGKEVQAFADAGRIKMENDFAEAGDTLGERFRNLAAAQAAIDPVMNPGAKPLYDQIGGFMSTIAPMLGGPPERKMDFAVPGYTPPQGNYRPTEGDGRAVPDPTHPIGRGVIADTLRAELTQPGGRAMVQQKLVDMLTVPGEAGQPAQEHDVRAVVARMMVGMSPMDRRTILKMEQEAVTRAREQEALKSMIYRSPFDKFKDVLFPTSLDRRP